MQNVSNAYISSMSDFIRNHGYIKVYIGVINSVAQKNVNAEDDRNEFSYLSQITNPFNGEAVSQVYATAEQDFSRVDDTMYFAPPEDTTEIYNQGIITEDLLGSVYIGFRGVTGLDIKGLTIEFGEYYPTRFNVISDSGTSTYTNNNRKFVTEDVFDDTSYFIIEPLEMVNGNGRLRIEQFSCGIINVFTNQEVIKFTSKEYVSPICDSLPSMDTTLVVDNYNLYYSPDNPESTIAYMEQGQEVKTYFGYDSNGDGVIEWLPPTLTYLKSWSANDKEAKFTSTDLFDYYAGKYYKGMVEENNLYDLAIDVLTDMGAEEYFVDPYLKNVVINNPIPAVKHTEALQMIANAGRCVLSEDREGHVHIQSSFIPDSWATTNDETDFSNIANILNGEERQEYAITSKDFSVVDGSLFFMPSNEEYLNTGYISNSYWNGEEWDADEPPKITIELETAFDTYGLGIAFRSTYPAEIEVITYNDEELVEDITYTPNSVNFTVHNHFSTWDKMEIIFTEGYPNSRVVIDNISIGDVTDYYLSDELDLYDSPTSTRQSKVKSINVVKTNYSLSAEEAKDLKSEELTLNPDSDDVTVYFTKPSYNYTASIEENREGEDLDPLPYTVEIADSTAYMVTLHFEGITEPSTKVKYKITGNEYVESKLDRITDYNEFGEVIEWKNPLIDNDTLADDVRDWLSSYYLGDVDYQLKWRGDPRTDANDLFYLKLKERSRVAIRTYQNELSFDGSWKGTMKSRKVVI